MENKEIQKLINKYEVKRQETLDEMISLGQRINDTATQNNIDGRNYFLNKYIETAAITDAYETFLTDLFNLMGKDRYEAPYE